MRNDVIACRTLLLAGAAGLAMLAAPAAAQDGAIDTAAEADAEAEQDGGNTIVVTARRREERLIDVPISVTALTGETLQEQGILELTQIGQQVPNITLEVSRGTNTTLTAFIRGVGQQDPVAGFEAGVGLYIDDVYLNRPQAAVLDIYNVERIEVLRGPQGTLYGRNTIGGAIKYVTARLPDDPSLQIRGAYGSYDQADLIVTGSTPITDNLRIGASGARLSRGGFGENLTLGTENYNKDVWAARGTIEFDSGPVFVRLSGDYIKDDSEARQGHRLIPGLVSGAPVLDDVFDTRAGLDIVDQEVEAYGGALNIEVEVSDRITLKSITGYREDRSTTPIDFDSLPAVDVDVPAIYENDQFSQEFQLLYEGDRLSGVVGFYYLNANAFTAFDVALFTTLDGLTAQTLGDVDTDTWSVFADFTYDLTDTISVSLGGRYTNDKRSSRVLRTTFLGGFSDLFGGAGAPIAVTSDFEGSETFEDFNPRASISWQPNRDHNVYFTYSQGFKGGGFDPRGQTTAAPDLDGDGDVDFDDQFEFLRFAPETVDSFELGWKASLLDNRLNISLAGFLSQYSDVQIPGSVGFDSDGDGVNESFIGITSNAASADVNGIEFEGNALVGENFAGDGSRFSVNWSLGVLDAAFNTFIDAFGNDVADERVFQNTPDITGHMGFNLGIPAGGGMFDFIGLASLRSDASQFEVPNPFLDQDGFVLVDASVVYTSDDGFYSIGLHGKNLFDKEYIVAGYNFVAGGTPPGTPFVPTLGQEGTLTGFYGDPRRIYVTAQVNF
ncbi:TonB-dependent receptor [Erythrobacter sp. HL-111]|uniref:TonB-dependent receptor n=1 Tax=Erythrobacter sp. HL-111 TaxID=1798193 RepID=UPI0006D9DCF6|nr:TonB-dependent receptor [Erythrobacter sp. HL-111]KPP91210.1 MAG: TonB-dependent receptor [Erythrobacteraceae bacterium HL-111]SDT05793.1 iron complex outermembrane recepter protein [Erythrobacter sp. HL-111]